MAPVWWVHQHCGTYLVSTALSNTSSSLGTFTWAWSSVITARANDPSQPYLHPLLPQHFAAVGIIQIQGEQALNKIKVMLRALNPPVFALSATFKP